MGYSEVQMSVSWYTLRREMKNYQMDAIRLEMHFPITYDMLLSASLEVPPGVLLSTFLTVLANILTLVIFF